MLYNNTDTALKIVESLHAADNQDIRFDDSTNFDIKDGKITISGIPVSDNAAKDLLEYLQIKKGFIKKIGPEFESWEDLKNALRRLFIGDYLAIYLENGVIKKIRQVKHKYSAQVYQEVGDVLAQTISDITDRKIELSRSLFNDGKLILQFVNDNKIELPYNEFWKTGQSVCIDPFGVILEPYMERVICTNGLVRAVPSSKYSLTHGQSAEKLFASKIGKVDNNSIQQISDGIKRMKENNASVREFFAFRDLLNVQDNAEIQKVLSKNPGGETGGFNSDYLIKKYGDELIEKSDRWLSTADSGINAFDVLNSATYIASRANEFNISSNNVLKIQRLAAKTMLDTLDLQHVAPHLS